MGVDHGVIDVFAYQEALLIMAVFGIAILAMMWAGFRRWIRYKEEMARLIAAQTAERAAQHSAGMEFVEARLKAIEQIVADGGVQTPAQIEALGATPVTDPILKRHE